MGGVANESKFACSPCRQLLHIEQLPYFHYFRIDFLDESQEGWIKVLVNFQNLLNRPLFIPLWVKLVFVSYAEDLQNSPSDGVA